MVAWLVVSIGTRVGELLAEEAVLADLANFCLFDFIAANPVRIPGERIYTYISYTEVKSRSGINYLIISFD